MKYVVISKYLCLLILNEKFQNTWMVNEQSYLYLN